MEVSAWQTIGTSTRRTWIRASSENPLETLVEMPTATPTDERMRGRHGADDEDDVDEEGDDLQDLQREGNLGNERVKDRDM